MCTIHVFNPVHSDGKFQLTDIIHHSFYNQISNNTKAPTITPHNLFAPSPQVEVYQGDFRAEREAREALASERELLRDELKQLHARNTQLLDDLQATQHGATAARYARLA